MASSIVEKIFQRFPSMIPEIMDIIVKCLSKERDRAREVVEAIIDSEQHYLFTNDKGMQGNVNEQDSNDPRQGPGGGQGGNMGGGMGGGQMDQGYGRGGNAFVNEMRKRIDSYFSVVLRSVKDSVPKAIGFFLVK